MSSQEEDSSDDDFAAELEAEMTVEQEQKNPIVAAPAVVIATQAPSTGRGAVSSPSIGRAGWTPAASTAAP